MVLRTYPYVRSYDIDGGNYYDKDDLHNLGFNAGSLTPHSVEHAGQVRHAYHIPHFPWLWWRHRRHHRPWVHHISGSRLHD